jgi:methylglyoxal synthase
MNIALIAHDKKKELMASFCIAYRGILKNHNLYATGTTGSIIIKETGLSVNVFLPGFMGEQQISARAAYNELDLVIFFRDPVSAQMHEPDISNLLRSCDTNNIPFATNLGTAELLIRGLDRGDLDWREIVSKQEI